MTIFCANCKKPIKFSMPDFILQGVTKWNFDSERCLRQWVEKEITYHE